MGHFPFNKNCGLKFRKFHVPNGTVHSGCTDTPDTSHRVFGYCPCKHDAKELFWGQHFCQMERDISVRPTEMTRPVKEDHLQSWSCIYPSDQTEMVRSIWCTNRNFRKFWVELKAPRLSFAYSFFTVFPAGPFLWSCLPVFFRLGLALSSNGPLERKRNGCAD